MALFNTKAFAVDDESQAELRQNPEFETVVDSVAVDIPNVDYAQYPFLKVDCNKIISNGADWSSLRAEFADAKQGLSRFSTLLLGDSHIQADFSSSELRKRMARVAGSAGRGLIIPFKLAGTNQPVDYKIRMSSAFTASRLLRMPWATDMPFTGIGIQPEDKRFTLKIESDSKFCAMRFYFHGTLPEVESICSSDGEPLIFVRTSVPGEATEVVFPDTYTEVEVSFSTESGVCVFGGVELIDSSSGTNVHAIGNNGATYSSYALVDGFAEGVSSMSPDLIIVSLGTNEAFGNASDAAVRASIDELMTSLRQHNPDAVFLLTTPAECYRKVRRRTKKGGRRSVSVVNTKVERIRNIILDYASEKGIAVYDWYNIAGGAGAAEKWRKYKLLGADGVHDTVNGYRISGNMLADALIDALSSGF